MRGGKSKHKIQKAGEKDVVRVSISFPPELYSHLEELARQKKVSLAWVVRDAAEKYVESGAKMETEGREK
jgi:metal-responsive CopG/Arc/MetJ family transcriptional regulator